MGGGIDISLDQKTHPVVKWRGIIVCAHSVPKLDAWAKSLGQSILLWPLAGCGSYQTSTVASAGTHAGGGAVDIDLRNVPADKRKWVADQGRLVGLQISWHRRYIAGLWTWHAHVLDPACTKLSSAAVGQCLECFAGGDGLVGSTVDGNTRANISVLKSIFNNRFQVSTPASPNPTPVPVVITDVTRVKSLQTATRAWMGVNGIWENQTDIDLRNTRAVALEKYSGAYFKKWSLEQRKRMQASWGVVKDGIWGGATKNAAIATTIKIQKGLGVVADGVWGAVTDKAYMALRSRTYRRFDISKPTGAFPTPGVQGTMYGPSVSGRPWYSGRVGSNTRTAGQIQWQIKRIQRMVGVKADGIYGGTTTAAVKRWQTAKKLRTADGIVGPGTWSVMVKANVV